MRKLTASLPAIALALVTTCAIGQDVKTTTAIQGLDNPAGIAVQPKTGTVFVSESGGARVLRLVDGKVENVVVGFPLDVYGKGPMYNIGPLGLGFLNRNTLVVGGGGYPDGKELLRVYKVPAEGSSIKAGDMTASFSLPAENEGEADEIKGEGNFYALAVTKSAVFVTSNGDDTKGWVNKATVEGGKVTGYERSIATKEATEVDAPVGATIHPKSGDLVVGQMGEITVPGDSLLTFYDNDSGEMKANFETGLFDITALAYSPKTSKLYALDFAWMDTGEGGLFRIDAKADGDKQTIDVVKVLSLDKPTAMAFGDDGSLYITVLGTAEEGAKVSPGKVLKIAPGL